MDKETRQIAVKQYLKYFTGLFILVGLIFVAFLITLIVKSAPSKGGQEGNTKAPKERVFDNGDIFSKAEEEQLEEKIKEIEKNIGCHIVIVSINQPVEGYSAKSEYGYRYTDWEKNMRDLADDFYDNNNFGYDKAHGDGVLLLTNDYAGQKGTWLSTSGKAEKKLSSGDIDRILTTIDNVYYSDENANYEAHVAGLKSLERNLKGSSSESEDIASIFYLSAIAIPILIAGVYMAINIKTKEGKETTNMNTYVDANGTNIVESSDIFMHKTLTKRRIETNSGGGHGGGGHHMSGGGFSHGGGGHRR